LLLPITNLLKGDAMPEMTPEDREELIRLDRTTPEEVQELIRRERICTARTQIREAKSRLQDLQAEAFAEMEKIRKCTELLHELGADPDGWD
jgi:ribosome recycling factor